MRKSRSSSTIFKSKSRGRIGTESSPRTLTRKTMAMAYTQVKRRSNPLEAQVRSNKRQSNDGELELPVREKRRRSSKGQSSDTGTMKSVPELSGQSRYPLRLHDSRASSSSEGDKPLSSDITHSIHIGNGSPVLHLETNDEYCEKGEQQSEHHGTSDSDVEEEEAPETISHAHAEAYNRAAQAEEANVRKQLELEAKTKRRKRDQDLREQVKISERRQTMKEALTKSVNENRTPPPLLPEALLALVAPSPESSSHSPNGMNTEEKYSGSSKQPRGLELETPALQEIIRSGHKVRLLHAYNELLPPKPSPVSQTLRNSWLYGRASLQRGERGATAYRRRTSTQPFI